MSISSHPRSRRSYLVLSSVLLAGCAAKVDDLFPGVAVDMGAGGRLGATASGGPVSNAAGAGRASSAAGGALPTEPPRDVAEAGRGPSSAASGGRTASIERDAGESPLPPIPACDPCPCGTGPFGTPELVTGLGLSLPLFGPALSADALHLYFSRIDGDEDIFTATRTGRGAAFLEASPVPNLDLDGSEEGTPFISADGLSLYFFSTRSGPGARGGRDLWQASRASAALPFVEPFVVPVVNGESLDHLPRLSGDELSLMFVSGRASPNAVSNIWVTERSSADDNFSEPVEVLGVNSDAREEGFSLSSDGLTLFFSSNRLADDNDMDIWVATRATPAAEFGAAENLSIVNTGSDELDPALSADGFELFFASSRNGVMQLFRSVRSCD